VHHFTGFCYFKTSPDNFFCFHLFHIIPFSYQQRSLKRAFVLPNALHEQPVPIQVRRTVSADRDPILAFMDGTQFFRPDEMEIARRGILRTPGLYVDGKLVSYGRVPSPGDIAVWISEA